MGVEEVTVIMAQLVKGAREAMTLSIADVEKMTGLSSDYLEELENGMIENPSCLEIAKLILLYQLDVKKSIEIVLSTD